MGSALNACRSSPLSGHTCQLFEATVYRRPCFLSDRRSKSLVYRRATCHPSANYGESMSSKMPKDASMGAFVDWFEPVFWSIMVLGKQERRRMSGCASNACVAVCRGSCIAIGND